MHANQKTFVRDGVSIPLPVRTVDLHVSPDFSGRVLVYLQSGLVSERRLADDEMILPWTGLSIWPVSSDGLLPHPAGIKGRYLWH